MMDTEQIALKYRTIADSIPQLVWENDAAGRASYFNNKWFEYSGLSWEQSSGVGWITMAHPHDTTAIKEWELSRLQKTIFEAEVRLRRYDGTYHWHLLRNVPVRDYADQVQGWFGTATDIEKQKTTEQQLVEKSTMLRTILETARDFAIITISEDGLIVDWNSGAERLFGYERNEAIGQTAEIIFTEDDRKGGIPEAEILLASENGQARDERWHIRKDGSRFFMSGVMARISDDSLKGFVKIARDITDRKLSEEALQITEQKKTLAVQSGQMGEWSFDITKQEIEVNAQCSSIFGLDPIMRQKKIEELVLLIHDEDRTEVRKHLNTALRGLNIFHAEFRMRAGDDLTYKWISAYGRVIAHNDGVPVRMIGVLHDITEKKLLEKQKDDFISIASHELKSPVTSIKSYSELLQDNLDAQGDTNNAGLVKKLGEQVDRLVKLIYNLLDYSSLGELKMKLYPEPFDMNQLISEQVAGLQSPDNTHMLIWKPSPVGNIHADRERVRQVLENLVSNAIKYSEPGSEVIIATRDLLDSLEVSVTDSGIGIPAEAQGQIFERYFRVSENMETYNRGLGLGLYISAEIIRQHHGTIRVESAPGKGSKFFITLPYS